MKQKLFIVFLLSGLFCYHTGFSQTTKNQIIQEPFKTDLYSNGKIYFQKTNDSNNPIDFIVEYNLDGENKKYIVDNYAHAGADPEIRSVFLMIFVINNIFV